MDKFEKVKTLEATDFWFNNQPPQSWGVKLTNPGDVAVKFIDGTCEVFTHEEMGPLHFKLRPAVNNA